MRLESAARDDLPRDRSREVAVGWRHSQVVRRGSAKPLFPGSNPGAASNPFRATSGPATLPDSQQWIPRQPRARREPAAQGAARHPPRPHAAIPMYPTSSWTSRWNLARRSIPRAPRAPGWWKAPSAPSPLGSRSFRGREGEPRQRWSGAMTPAERRTVWPVGGPWRNARSPRAGWAQGWERGRSRHKQ